MVFVLCPRGAIYICIRYSKQKFFVESDFGSDFDDQYTFACVGKLVNPKLNFCFFRWWNPLTTQLRLYIRSAINLLFQPDKFWVLQMCEISSFLVCVPYFPKSFGKQIVVYYSELAILRFSKGTYHHN